MTKKTASVPEIELELVRLKVVIEADYVLDTWDNGSDIDQSIEEALEALQRYGAARVIGRKLTGVPKGGKSPAPKGPPVVVMK